MKITILNIIFYGSYISIIFLAAMIFYTVRGNLKYMKLSNIILYIFLLLMTLLFIYSRFIEPNIIISRTTKIEVGFSAKVIVISDIHLGIYKDIGYIKKIVAKINEIKDIDFVLIPGDFSYYPSGDLDKIFSPLKYIKYPVYGVLGNHDCQKPGPDIQDKLESALKSNGVILLQNDSVKNKNITILGLGDYWAGEDNVSLINKFRKEDNLVVMTHNPDTTEKYDNLKIADLTIAGHTHGGQIRIPLVYKKIIPSYFGFNEGFYDKEKGKIFVSAGVGTTGLPMRFLIPPRIDILELY